MNRLLNRNDNVAILLAGIFSGIVGMGVARFVFTSLLPDMLDDFLTLTFAGILAALNFAGYMGGSILSVFIKDINQKVILYRIGIVLCLLTTILLGLTTNETLWLISRIIAGFGSAMLFVVGSAIVMTKLTFENKTKAMGIHFSGIGFSILVTDLVSRAVLSSGYTWQNSWIVLTIFGAVLSCYCWYILCFDKEVHQKVVKHKFDFSLFNLYVILLIMAYFTEGVGFVVQATFLPDIINSLEGLEGYGNLTWTLVGIAGIPSSIIWLRLAHKYGSINIIMIALLVQVVGILIPALTNNIVLNLLSGILYGGTFIGLVGLFMNLGGKLSQKNPVVLMGALTTSYGVGQVIAPLYSVALTHHYGNYNMALYVTAAIVVGGILLLMIAKKLETVRN
ncbi:YbfB/YjiJ family MFS transporter [Candidatus Marinarcus aquaticus]|uniref:MFS transporter n=1 Tax=Candidatus Marinarcus aquaticus TaxID=2044504 RepID=A0A4Q0XT91_9BACT|nr:YbfB/YjiJ family MFS transporter [Candidatus Marinarcus aquaticus]RXJ60562.1 MFS transporter [Candidatus Marinarcus aquaticus]